MLNNWLIKYYIIAFIAVFSIYYYIERKEPYVNWNLYPKISESDVKKIIINKKCEDLNILYKSEFDSNYKKNFLGINIRADSKSVRGLNLLKYLEFHSKRNNCSSNT